jgi:hypothetical protein
MLTQPFAKAPLIMPMINIGALQDIPTGKWERGAYGEYILNGGLAIIEGVTGRPNMFKSTFQRYRSLRASARIPQSVGSIFDTEVNMHEGHQAHFAAGIPEFEGEQVFDTGRWVISNKAQYSGNEYYALQKEFLEGKVKNAKDHSVVLPLLDRDSAPMKVIIPSFSNMDSITQFDTDEMMRIQKDNNIDDSSGKVIYALAGLAKKRLLDEAPRLMIRSSNYLSMTAHLTKKIELGGGGPGKSMLPDKQLKFLKGDDVIKGAGPGFLTLTHNLWYIYNTSPLINQADKTVLYPKNRDDDLNLDTDLNEVTMINLRGKSGVSGLPVRVIISQKNGVMPELSEFRYLKETGNYGFEGNNTTYNSVFLPEVKIMRTTIRSLIEENPLLCRALNIQAEMCQMDELWDAGMGPDVQQTPKQLYETLKAKGYNWEVLLKTRGWYTYNNDQHKVPFLSTMDLLCMTLPEDHPSYYFPFWMDPATKDIKAEYREKYMTE